MKKLLSLLALTLWSLVSLAQTTTKIAELNPAPGKTGSKYFVYYERDWNLFPPTTSGLNSLTTAIASGQLQLSVTTTGCVIPKGTRPPASAPTCNNSGGLPVLASNTGLNSFYSYSTSNGGTLQIRASGSTLATLKFETVSGQVLTLSNSQNPTIPYNTYVGYGPSGDSSYPMDWTAYGVPQVPLKISMKTGGSADVVTFTPVVGSNLPLTGPTGTTITNPPSETTTTPPTSGSVDSQGFLVYEDQGWSGADIKRIENNEMFLEFKRSVGACVTGAGLKSNNRNVVNDEQVTQNGVTFSDKGVQWQLSPYAWPAANNDLTIGSETRGGTGDNPVQGGSANPYFQPGKIDKSAIINTPDRGVVFCARVRGLLWDWFSVPGHMPVDIEWWFLPNKVITYRARLTVEPRPSTWSGTQRFQSLSQELLCLYNIGAFNTHLTNVNGQEISLRDGIPLGGQSDDYFTSGCWAATYQPDRQEGVLYYTPRNSVFKSWQKMAEQGEWPDPGMSYINASVKRTYDIAGTQTIDNGYIILGSQSSAMARMAQLEPIDQSYDFNFLSLDNQWWNEDARVMRNSNGSLRFYCGDEKFDNNQTHTGGRFQSPCRAWQASQFANVEFDMAVSGVNSFYLTWGKPGKFGQFEYKQLITVNGDGQRRTYQFNLSNLPNWNGTITYLGLQAAEEGKPAAYVDMYRARKF